LRAAQQRAAAALAELGCTVEHLDTSATRALLPETSQAFSVWAAMLGHAQPVAFRQLISDGRAAGDELTTLGALRELVRCLLGGGASARHTLPAVALAIIDDLERALLAPVRRRLLRHGATLRSRLDALLPTDGHTVLLLPSLLTPAPRHHENMLRFPDACQTALFNVMQLPATAVPLAPSPTEPPATHLPLGCQVVAGFGDDHNALAVAIALEAAGVARAAPCPAL